MKLTIGHLYPDLLNLYGDRGNIQCMMKRSQWRGIEAETIEFTLEDTIDFSKLDIVLLGGGSDREQMIVCSRLRDIQKDFKAYVEDGGTVLAVCGGYQLLATQGHELQVLDVEVPADEPQETGGNQEDADDVQDDASPGSL